jgi:transcription antitermination factor NusG
MSKTEHDKREAKWYAACVRHQNENRVEDVLLRQGWETLVPRYRCRRQWTDRVKEIEKPLFAGFVFCRFEAGERMRIENIPGVLGVVNFSGVPAEIDASEIESLRTVAQARLALGPWPYLKQGDRVRVERGPLRGLEGSLLRTPEGARLIVSVEMLQRSIACALDPESVVPLRVRVAAGGR